MVRSSLTSDVQTFECTVNAVNEIRWKKALRDMIASVCQSFDKPITWATIATVSSAWATIVTVSFATVSFATVSSAWATIATVSFATVSSACFLSHGSFRMIGS